MIDLLEELNEAIYDEDCFVRTGVKLYEECYFTLLTTGYSSSISLSINNSEVFILDDESDRGWNDELDDYERTEKEQVIKELEDYIKVANIVLGKIKDGK